MDFMTNTLQPLISSRNFGILDNSSTHKTLAALEVMRDCFTGQYAFSAQYYPELKPIERGFSQVKRWLRHHEDACLGNPIFWINKAFQRYSINGKRRDRCTVVRLFVASKMDFFLSCCCVIFQLEGTGMITSPFTQFGEANYKAQNEVRSLEKQTFSLSLPRTRNSLWWWWATRHRLPNIAKV